jgi:hypothetical protein
MITLQCQCCKIVKNFADEQAAFDAGWDAPPHFTTHVCCDLCPAVCVVLGATHSHAHADWEKNGRPQNFDSRCITDDQWGKMSNADLQEQEQEIKKLLASILKLKD